MTARELRPLGETLGTEALGVDLSQPLDDETFAWIEPRFCRAPGAGVSRPASRRRRNRRLRPAVRHAAQSIRWSSYRHAEHPEVSWLTNVDKDGNIDWFGVKRATDWHTDSPYEEVPPLLAILHAKEMPSTRAARCSPICAPPMTARRGDEGAARRSGRIARPHDGPAGVGSTSDPEEKRRPQCIPSRRGRR